MLAIVEVERDTEAEIWTEGVVFLLTLVLKCLWFILTAFFEIVLLTRLLMFTDIVVKIQMSTTARLLGALSSTNLMFLDAITFLWPLPNSIGQH